MKRIQETLGELRKKVPHYEVTPEQLEKARAAAMARNTICVPGCPECNGLGYVRGEDGKLQVCSHVDPLTVYPLERYGLAQSEAALEWSAVKAINGGPVAAAAVQETLQRGAGWVYMHGDPGLAKTLILKVAVATAIRERRQAAYVRMAEILDDLRGAFDKNNPSEESQRRLDWWSSIPLLAIDEFDRVNQTEYAKERSFLLMDRRYESAIRGKTITLMASNGDPDKMDSYLVDRINDRRFTVVHMTGKSARRAMGWEK